MLYIVRHGKTILNVKKIYGWRIDSELLEEGREEAKIVKEKLKNIKFDVIISSPLKRAIETAKIISNEKIIIDSRIIERDNGDFEGKPKGVVPSDFDFNNPNEHRFNVENILDFRNRINGFLNDILEKYGDKNVLIITHAGVMIYMKCFFEGEPKNNDYKSYKPNNGEILVYDNSLFINKKNK